MTENNYSLSLKENIEEWGKSNKENFKYNITKIK